jgi:hypothetical protein
MSDDIVTMFAQAYSKKKPTLLSQQGSNVKIKLKKKNGKKAFRK